MSNCGHEDNEDLRQVTAGNNATPKRKKKKKVLVIKRLGIIVLMKSDVSLNETASNPNPYF